MRRTVDNCPEERARYREGLIQDLMIDVQGNGAEPEDLEGFEARLDEMDLSDLEKIHCLRLC